MRPLRPYQQAAVDAVVRAGREVRRVCLVAPTGAGKTRMGVEFVARAIRSQRRVLWICHRTELLSQAAEAIASEVGAQYVQLLGESDTAPVLVATVQSLARATTLEPSLTILDECHHYQADQWGDVARRWPGTALLGLTATPERSDGRPLGDLFDRMVVASQYSQLIAAGYIVPCRVLCPVEAIASGQLALAPLLAYLQHGEGRSGFAFCSSIEAAEALAEAFRGAGVPAACISERTPAAERRAAVAGLHSGAFRMLTNVYALTEGVDVPTASVCVLARGSGHVSPYLQMVGRVLRSSPGKRDALLIDLSGAALKHGAPTQDREYSLGEGIVQGETVPALAQCLRCGYCWDTGAPACPECGWAPERSPSELARMAIAGVPLRELALIPDVQGEVLSQLRARQLECGYGLYWVTRRYKEVTGLDCPPIKATMTEKRDEMQRLERVASERGWQRGATAHMFRRTFGVWPKLNG